MKLSFDWLCDFADFRSISQEKILEKISLAICEVDHLEEFRPELQSVYIVKITSLEKHPDADKLKVAKVSLGNKKLTIVTGAPNVEIGDIVPLATPGTIIGGKEIKETQMRGILSQGMLASEKELGLSEDSSGVMKFSKDTTIGQSIRDFLQYNDFIFTIDNKSITHRPDLWSHFGFARELSAQIGIPLKENPFNIKVEFSKKGNVNVRQNQNAHAYFASEITVIKVQNSNQKIKARLEKCGVRSINNIVDVSNYAMLEMGQATHFFDLAKMGKKEIEVSFSKDKEKILLLDETEPELSSSVLLIRNEGIPVAIAGVMGGKETSVTNETISLLLESAVFKREDIRKSIRETGIRSEASIRYEKGLDSSTCIPLIRRCVSLLKENGCPELVATEPVGFDNSKDKEVIIKTTYSFIKKKLGKEFKNQEITEILKKLYFEMELGGEFLTVKVPRHRHNYDITIPEDLVEEVGRTIGYAALPHDPIRSDVEPLKRDTQRNLERKIKNLFISFAYCEVFNYSFTSPKENAFEEKMDSLPISNAMPEEFSELRNSIYPSLLKNLSSNADRFEDIKIFEYGRTYHPSPIKGELASEKKWFGFSTYKSKREDSLAILEKEFINFRTQIESVLKGLGIFDYKIITIQKSYFHPNCGVEIILGDKTLGEIGILHPRWNDHFGLRKKVLTGRLSFDSIQNHLFSTEFKSRFKSPSTFPQGQLDISVVIPKSKSTYDFVQKVLNKKLFSEMEDIYVKDIYVGESIPAGFKSVTYRLDLITYEESFTQAKFRSIQESLVKFARDEGFEVR